MLRNRGEVRFQLLTVQIQAVEPIYRIQIDRYRNQFVVDTREHPVLVGSPFGELGQVIENFGGIGVKDMWTVAMNQNTGVVQAVVGVTADVVSSVDDEYRLIELSRHSLRDDRPREARA